VVLSMDEVDYLEACVVVVCLPELLSRLFGVRLEVTYVWCDNQSCMNSL
jgi:hypothetical protein